VSLTVPRGEAAPAPSARLLRGMEAWAAAAPLLCALHCLAAPLVVLFAPRLAAAEAHEPVILGASFGLAATAAVLGMRVHRRRAPLLLAAAGGLLWLATLRPIPLSGEAASVAASLLMAAGTLWSARLRHRATCPRCGCPASASPLPPRTHRSAAGRSASRQASAAAPSIHPPTNA
jgi:hypothetical protein